MAKRVSKKKRQRRPNKSSIHWIRYLLILVVCGVIIWLIGSDSTLLDKLISKKASPQSEFDLKSGIEMEGKKLGIPEGSIRVTSESNKQVFHFPINKKRMDLTFANIFLKRNFEKQGITLSSGKVVDNQQILTFRRDHLEFDVVLSYSPGTYAASANQKSIAIVVDDFGMIGDELLQEYLTLPTEVCFAILPYFPNSVPTMNQAHQQGRETLVHVPMEPIEYPRQNPGKKAIFVQMTQSEVEKTLTHQLNELPLCMGINNHMGSLATTDPDIMTYVMDVLRKQNKAFLDSRTTNVSIAYQTAQKALLPAYRNDLFLDSPDIQPATMTRKIEQIKNIGLGRNEVIAITHCHTEAKLQYLKTFIEKIKAEGFTLVPLSSIGKYNVPLII